MTLTTTSLVDLIRQGIDAWLAAGTIVMNRVDSGETLEEIAAECACDFVTVGVLSQFERIGRKQILPRILVSDFPAVKQLSIMPIAEQERLLDGYVDLVVKTASGVDTLRVRVRDLSRRQVRQVFSNGTIRDKGAQRAWLEDHLKVPQAKPSWSIRGKTVVFYSPCTLSRQDILAIASQL